MALKVSWCALCMVEVLVLTLGVCFWSVFRESTPCAVQYSFARALLAWAHGFRRDIGQRGLVQHVPPKFGHRAEPFARAGHLSLTASLRFDGALNVDVTECQTNLVLYPHTLCCGANGCCRRGGHGRNDAHRVVFCWSQTE